MDLTWLWKWVLPIGTIVAAAASAIAHNVFGVSHPLVVDQVAGWLGAATAAKAAHAAHDMPGGGA